MKALKTLISDGNDLLTITPDQLDGWPTDVPESATITIEVNGTTAEGVVDSSAMTLIAASPIVAPKGSCVEYSWIPSAECGDTTGDKTVCTSSQTSEVTPSLKLAVLDENNCPTSYLTLQDLMGFLSENQAPVSLCEMLSASPAQPTADMKVLGLSNGCDLIQVPASAFDCTNTDPEDFSCE